MPKRNIKGNGTIVKRPNGTYEGKISLGYDENGKRKRKTVYGKTKTEVQQKIKQIEYDIKSGTFVDKSGITIYHLGKQLLDDDYNLNHIKEVTYFRNLETLKRLKPIYNIPLQYANETLLKQFLLDEQGYSQSVIKKDYALLNRIFREAVKRHIVAVNPMEDIKQPKSKKESIKVRALTVDEQKKLYTVLTTEDINYSRQMLLSMLTGMRMGEINALEVKDVDFRFRNIRINKTMSRGEKGKAIVSRSTKTEAGTRTIPMTDDVDKILRDSIGNKKSGQIFTRNDKLITTCQVNEQYKRVLRKYDIIDNSVDGRVDLHSLRHTYATRCIEANMPAKVLQTLLGHTDIKITLNTYCDAFDNFQTKAIEQVTEYMKTLGLSEVEKTG